MQAAPAKKLIIGTEGGLLHRLRKGNPDKEFILGYEGAICPNMKLNTLERIHLALKEEKYQVNVPNPIARKARKALERMFTIT